MRSCALRIISQTKMREDRKVKGAVDKISNLPDVILQHILCFVPTTKVAISTSLLSRRWRHVWCEVQSISLDVDSLTSDPVIETLTRYTAPKTKSFQLIVKLTTPTRNNIPYYIEIRLIKFAMSHNVENLSLDFSRSYYYYYGYMLPDFFYSSSSVKQLTMTLGSYQTIVPECTVSWTSLQNELKVLDLSKSLRLRTFVNVCGPNQILHDSHLSCSLVDIASLTEANLEISSIPLKPKFNGDFLQGTVKMLKKLKNAEKLKLGGNFIQILSLAEIGGVPFPMFKVKVLTLDTMICQCVIPGIERLLQNSHDLEKLIISGRSCSSILEGVHLAEYFKSQSLNTYQCWRSKNGFNWNTSCWNLQPKHVTSFVDLVLKNTEKLDKMDVRLDERYVQFKTEDVVVPTLSPNRNVTIVLSSTTKNSSLQLLRLSKDFMERTQQWPPRCALVIILQTKMTDDRKIEGAEDLISNLPDVILQHILCFVPTTKVAIRTSLLSRRWRHVWCEVPSLPLDVGTLTTAASVNEALTRYTAPKTKSFHLTIKYVMKNIPYMDTWIKFAMSHSVENLSLDFLHHYYRYKLPDFLYNSSSVKQLNIKLSFYHTIVPPECTVSWTSLRNLSLTCYSLSDESMAKILSGCPILENLSLNFPSRSHYKLPDFFYNTSSFKRLNITLSRNQTIVPQCTVSWTSLHKLSLKFCRLSDESMAKILSGCPVLEYLKLYHCGELNVLDLSQSPRLRTLEVIRNMTTVRGPRQIVAPHIHCLRLYDPQLSCSLVDVASLTEARLEISCVSLNSDFNANFLQVVVLKMLENLKNAEKVKLGRNFIQILSLAEIRGVPFPVLKVKALTLDTKISHYVIPGIERLLQNSPDLEKLTVGGRAPFRMPVVFLDKYLKLQGFNVNKCWRSKDGGASWNEEHCVDAKLEHVASLVELLLINCTEKLYKIVLLLDERYLKFKTEDLTATLSHNNNVTIVLISL
ncbi:hypothetical protein HID58_019201 [Brassica napus]|uniref:F-box domain-containing protein n=2 Tax=Brassica napus TaxID=3708 RepID=A0ABQ8DC23_BRANA|nr:hypothetical protein HID58_019201 [Brassica napus]